MFNSQRCAGHNVCALCAWYLLVARNHERVTDDGGYIARMLWTKRNERTQHVRSWAGSVCSAKRLETTGLAHRVRGGYRRLAEVTAGCCCCGWVSAGLEGDAVVAFVFVCVCVCVDVCIYMYMYVHILVENTHTHTLWMYVVWSFCWCVHCTHNSLAHTYTIYIHIYQTHEYIDWLWLTVTICCEPASQPTALTKKQARAHCAIALTHDTTLIRVPPKWGGGYLLYKSAVQSKNPLTYWKHRFTADQMQCWHGNITRVWCMCVCVYIARYRP